MTRLRSSKTPLGAILDVLVWALLVGALSIVVMTVLVNHSLVGGYRSFVVQSGSMEPAIMTGDIIVVHAQEQYQKRDVITFRDARRIVTHRIQTTIEKGQSLSYVTKGDANRTQDDGVAKRNDVLGKVVLVVPKLGYLVHFAQSPTGFIVLIVVPLFLLVLDGLIQFIIHG